MEVHSCHTPIHLWQRPQCDRRKISHSCQPPGSRPLHPFLASGLHQKMRPLLGPSCSGRTFLPKTRLRDAQILLFLEQGERYVNTVEKSISPRSTTKEVFEHSAQSD